MPESGTNQLTEGHLNLLQTIYDVLRTQDRWPPYRFLEDYLDTKYRLDIEKLAGTLPRNLTTLPLPWHPKNDQQEIQLTIEGLRHVELPGASDDVGLFFRIFRRFVEELNRLVPTIDAQPNACLTTDGLTIEWSVHPMVLRRVFRIALLEPWSAGGGAIGSDALNFQVCAYPRALRPYRGAQTLEEYLELRRRVYPLELPPEPTGVALQRAIERLGGAAPVAEPVAALANAPVVAKDWDVFICHASADKESLVRRLANALKAAGLKVWYDDFELRVGDSLRRRIDEGLVRSRYGVVVLSPNFFERTWPQTELDGLASRQNAEGRNVILPVLHNVTVDQVREKSPTLAGLVAVSSDRGTPYVIEQLLNAMDFPPPLEVTIQASKDQT